MRSVIPKNLLNLADACQFSLYIIGGSVRDFLCGFPVNQFADWDICAGATEEDVLSAAEKAGFTVRSVYKHTGTVMLTDSDGIGYEFTRFRSDKYVRGLHTPSEITFTEDIKTDARRRDFTCNAIYYEIKTGTFCDPLNGLTDIRTRTLRTVAPAKKVFGEDGLRLMRLCRFAAQLGFTPDHECLQGAKTHSALIQDIAPERIYTELILLLNADEKHGVADGPYRGLCLLRDTGVLRYVIPELALGDGMKQRPDFHDYDVLEHSFRTVLYAPQSIRLAALLHDVGKPFCSLRDGNVHAHADEGARIAREILARLKAPKKLTAEVEQLILYHMRDLDCRMRESKVRKAILDTFPLFEKLLALKQADFSACKDNLNPAPTVTKWQGIQDRMIAEGAPRTMSELKLRGHELIEVGIPPQRVGHVLKYLLEYAAMNGKCNEKRALLKYALDKENK